MRKIAFELFRSAKESRNFSWSFDISWKILIGPDALVSQCEMPASLDFLADTAPVTATCRKILPPTMCCSLPLHTGLCPCPHVSLTQQVPNLVLLLEGSCKDSSRIGWERRKQQVSLHLACTDCWWTINNSCRDTRYNKEELLNNPVCFCSYIAASLDNILLLVLSFCCPCMMLNWNNLFSSEQKAFRGGRLRNHRKQANKTPFIFNSQKFCPCTEVCYMSLAQNTCFSEK